MSTPFEELYLRLQQANEPEEIFGSLLDANQNSLKQRYRELIAVVHPDRNPGKALEATTAAQQLQQWYERARAKIDAGSYGKTPEVIIETRHARYIGYGTPITGDLCELYLSEANGQPALIKIVRNLRNNDLLEAEARAIHTLDRQLASTPIRAHFPHLIEAFRLRDGAGVERAGTILQLERDTISLAEVRAAYPDGLDLRDAAWMFNRLLAALATAHDNGLIHGAVLPEHILVRPADHNGVLIDWCYNVAPGAQIAAISPAHAAWYPPEVAAREPASAATDLFMAAQCLRWLLGDDPTNPNVSERIIKPVRALLRACLLSAPTRRHNDAWQLLDDFRSILAELYGPPVFRPFTMPTRATRHAVNNR